MTDKYTNAGIAVCKGSWALGTACGRCQRCLDTRPKVERPRSRMVEKISPVTIEVARAYCGDCTHIESELKPTGKMLLVDPPRYEYKCEACGKTEALENHYPHLIYDGASSL